ncbi:MAG: hypothetical protein K2Q26_05125 [Bdellovibrionales bacterium]|nr:hypothetical protein [Bdellovibrionales bacterium]
MNWILIFVSILGLGCQKKYKDVSITWTKNDGVAAPAISSKFSQPVFTVPTLAGTVERFVQLHDSAEVENSNLQIIKNGNDPIFVSATYSNHPSDHLKAKIRKLHVEKDEFLKLLPIKIPELRHGRFLTPIKLVFSNKGKFPLFYKVDFLSEKMDLVERLKITTDFKFISREQVSSYFDGRGKVYPSGPQWSHVEEVLLPGLMGDGTLTGQYVKVITDTNTIARSPQELFFFNPEDPRFDQVQVYHFVQKVVQSFKNRLGVDLPFSIEVKTHLGAPAKKSAMFYHDQRIYLGQGDGVSYKDILKDPTIVMHETVHAFVDALSSLPQGSLNEAFADFYTTSFLDHPHLGEVSYLNGPYTRSVDNNFTLSDQKNTVYGDSLIVSGTLWELRKTIGVQKAELLALKTLVRLNAASTLVDFGKTFSKMASEQLTKDENSMVSQVLVRRRFL